MKCLIIPHMYYTCSILPYVFSPHFPQSASPSIYSIMAPPTMAATPASRPFWLFTKPAALVLVGLTELEAV